MEHENQSGPSQHLLVSLTAAETLRFRHRGSWRHHSRRGHRIPRVAMIPYPRPTIALPTRSPRLSPIAFPPSLVFCFLLLSYAVPFFLPLSLSPVFPHGLPFSLHVLRCISLCLLSVTVLFRPHFYVLFMRSQHRREIDMSIGSKLEVTDLTCPLLSVASLFSCWPLRPPFLKKSTGAPLLSPCRSPRCPPVTLFSLPSDD